MNASVQCRPRRWELRNLGKPVVQPRALLELAPDMVNGVIIDVFISDEVGSAKRRTTEKTRNIPRKVKALKVRRVVNSRGVFGVSLECFMWRSTP